MRINHEPVMSVAPSPRNSHTEVLGSLLDVPTRCQIIEWEFVLQNIHDGDEMLDECPDGFVGASENSSDIRRGSP